MTPAFILILIGIPSLKLLYAMDEVLNPLITLKITGNQWYWDYSIFDLNISSYMKEDYKWSLDEFLETDNPWCFAIFTYINPYKINNNIYWCYTFLNNT